MQGYRIQKYTQNSYKFGCWVVLLRNPRYLQIAILGLASTSLSGQNFARYQIFKSVNKNLTSVMPASGNSITLLNSTMHVRCHQHILAFLDTPELQTVLLYKIIDKALVVSWNHFAIQLQSCAY